MKIKFSFILILFLLSFQNVTPVTAGQHEHGDFDSGPDSPFTGQDHFPRDYFLIPNNLPHFLGLIFSRNGGGQLGLSASQIASLSEIKKKTLPLVMQKAREIKKMEVEIASAIAEPGWKTESLLPLVEVIARAKTELTKIHLRCLDQVRQELTDEQYLRLVQLSGQRHQ